MYISGLVSDLEKLVQRLRKRGNLTLAMLYNSASEADSNWNLIVSGPWMDKLGVSKATHIIARELSEALDPENRRAVSRISVLSTDDPFVRDMVRLYPNAADRRLPQVVAGHVTEGSGFILFSQKVA